MRPRVKFQEPVGSPQHHPAVVLVSRERKAASLFSDETAQKYPKACLKATEVNMLTVVEPDEELQGTW